MFPDYQIPLKILPLGKNVNFDYTPVYFRSFNRSVIKKVIGRIQYKIDLLIFKKMKLFNLSPSFIFIASA